MNLHCIGDSHCSFFLGYNTIINEYPHIAKSLVSNIFCYRLGPSLAYNVNRYNTTTKSREKIESIVARLDPQNNILMFCFGEIDCRAHILKQSQINKVDYKDIIDQCLSNYLEMIEVIKEKGFKIIIWNAIYSANYKETEPDLEYPYFGTVHDRNQVTKEFNNQLKKRTSDLGVDFLDITPLLIDDTTGLTKDEFYYDKIHMNDKLFLPVIKKINHLFGNTVFSNSQVLSYRVKALQKRSLNFIRNTAILNRIAKKVKKITSK